MDGRVPTAHPRAKQSTDVHLRWMRAIHTLPAIAMPNNRSRKNASQCVTCQHHYALCPKLPMCFAWLCIDYFRTPLGNPMVIGMEHLKITGDMA